MLYDLATILLIIGFSFLFKISITKRYDEQLIFILLALIIMVIYKYLTYRHLIRTNNTTINKTINKIEPYLDFTDEINKFMGQDIPNGINQNNINEYKSQISVLQDKVDTMNEYLKDLNERSNVSDTTTNNAVIGGLDFQTGQQIQDYRIKKAQQDIQRTADLIKQNRLAEDAKKYNKIKVFSSCVVAGADGSYSQDTPSTSGNPNNIISSKSTTQIVNPITGMTSSNISNLSSGSVSAPVSANIANTLGAGSGININDILQTIANNGIDINLV